LTASPDGPVSERRLVSVLFADLVGFTTLSERRDPEVVREMLSGYFERCRTLIERHGGTVEKFIGDAVMAVWGTPVAREDDAERAVRAALAVTAAVTAYGAEVGMPELRLRAGVLTGTAAVEVGAEGEGMVIGDTVNTASRLQSLAQPGTVLVDDVTRRASEAALAFEDAGSHQVKGRAQPIHAWQALRVVAGAGGARRGVGLEAPFVGREKESNAIIAAGEKSAADRVARLVCVVGEAGSGKSRLLWEFFKYLDGIKQERWWHQGRCLAYGEGVGFWALAEMVRARAGILEEEPPAIAREKLRACVYEHLADERERRLVEPRLAHLLRLEERSEPDRADLFSGWRLFFERLAGVHPVILAFEDLQWADSGLLEFVDYMMEWSSGLPIFILALGRPELRERRPGWEPIVLGPLAPVQVVDMLDGVAPGLPRDLVAAIAGRAEGIPLYAVETIRMLLDRGLIAAGEDGARYEVTGDVSDLEVPETLHALVAARLDGLTSIERHVVQDASVLGQSFSAAAVASVTERSESEVVPVLDALIAKQVLSRDADPRSPERGQYAFLQSLLRTVAYGTLGRSARKQRHLAAARHLESSWPGGLVEIAEVLASHYLEAIAADQDAADAPALADRARQTLIAAGEAAAGLALGAEASGYFEQAADLTEDPLEQAGLFERAGRALRQSGDPSAAERALRRAIALNVGAGQPSGGSAAIALGSLLRTLGRTADARVLLDPFRDPDVAGIDPVVRAGGLAELAVALTFAGELGSAEQVFGEALRTLEREQAWPALATALVSYAILRFFQDRAQESDGLLRLALGLAERHELTAVALRARYNLANTAITQDRFADALAEVDTALAIAVERGDREWELMLQQQSLYPLTALGRWDQAEPLARQLTSGQADLVAIWAAAAGVEIAVARGAHDLLDRCRQLATADHDTTHIHMRTSAAVVLADDALAELQPERALELARPVLDEPVLDMDTLEPAYAVCVQAAIALADPSAIDQLAAYVDALPPVRATSLLRAGRARLRAARAQLAGDGAAAERHHAEAVELYREVGARPLLAQALLEHHDRAGDPAALAEASEIYTELGATARLAQLEDPSGVVA
jgi:class 3 adenylate cyclase/tetratricopeptide (TPR) repeat protein